MFNDQQILQDLFDRCQVEINRTYGLDLLNLRDLHTGQVIGRLNIEVFHAALIDEGVLDDAESESDLLDIESLADTLLVRSLASARPSPALNHPTPSTLRRLLDSKPDLVCAYLLNRYHLKHWRKLTHRDDSWFDDILHRVKVWDKLTVLNDSSDQWERSVRGLCHWLLELDSKCNLHELNPPTDFFSRFFDSDLERFEQLSKDFELVAIPLITQADKNYSIGNRMASSAFLKSWFDNPTLAQRKVEIAGRKRQQLYDKYGSVQLGKLIEEDKHERKKHREAEKKAKDSRLIKGRSSRSKAAKLVNKHADKLDALFRTLGEIVESKNSTQAHAPKPKPRATNGLPKFVKG